MELLCIIIAGCRYELELRNEWWLFGRSTGSDDIGSCTGGTSIAGTPISDELELSLSAIESLRIPVSEVFRSPFN
jgi:hypothetical protein